MTKYPTHKTVMVRNKNTLNPIRAKAHPGTTDMVFGLSLVQQSLISDDPGICFGIDVGLVTGTPGTCFGGLVTETGIKSRVVGVILDGEVGDSLLLESPSFDFESLFTLLSSRNDVDILVIILTSWVGVTVLSSWTDVDILVGILASWVGGCTVGAGSTEQSDCTTFIHTSKTFTIPQSKGLFLTDILSN